MRKVSGLFLGPRGYSRVAQVDPTVNYAQLIAAPLARNLGEHFIRLISQTILVYLTILVVMDLFLKAFFSRGYVSKNNEEPQSLLNKHRFA